MAWALKHDIRHILIEPGQPMQNGYIENFNGGSGRTVAANHMAASQVRCPALPVQAKQRQHHAENTESPQTTKNIESVSNHRSVEPELFS
jgi:transposase InsO family protein